MKIYADHAATTQLDPDAFEAMKPYLLEEYGNPSQPYAFARPARRALRTARETIASCIQADPEEIFFTSGGTESDNWALKGTAFRCGKGKRILTSQIEHHAVLHSCEALARLGYDVTLLAVDGAGILQPETLAAARTDDVSLVSVMAGNNEIGTLEPVGALAAIAHGRGALFHTDAVQTVGHVPVDVRAWDVDLLSASAHKFNGPRGIGFLYIKKGTPMIPYEDGGAQESGLRAGTENVAAIVGMAAALEKNVRALTERTAHLRGLEEVLLGELRAGGADFRRNGADERIPGSLSLSFRGEEGERLLHRLDLMGIAVSTGSACDSRNTKLSHVLAALHLPQEYAYGTIRISLGWENTEEEARTIARALLRILHEKEEGR